jgi:hypothetical protein
MQNKCSGKNIGNSGPSPSQDSEPHDHRRQQREFETSFRDINSNPGNLAHVAQPPAIDMPCASQKIGIPTGRDESTASVERSRHVGFTPDSGRMAATQLNDVSGQTRKSPPP